MPMGKGEDDYMAESDMRTLIDAEKIKNDKKRYKAAMKKFKDFYAAVSDLAEDMAEEPVEKEGKNS